jgi:ribosomal protein S18 acetylase RimI-like enzyme
MEARIKIRKAELNDHDSLWLIIEQVISAGDTYIFSPDSDRKKMLEYWCGSDKKTYVAEIENQIVGTFILKDNFPDLGSHVANASYMTLPEAFGKGIGRLMGEFSMVEAKRLGYKAMQFNIVVKSNQRAISLWQKLGFEIKGEIPDAFNHKENGFTDAYIMWRKL